jgi:hypothetical protein
VEELNAEPPTSHEAITYFKQKYNTNSSLWNYLAHPSCSILFWTMMDLVPKRGTHNDFIPQLYVTSINNICGDCIAVPYDLTQNPPIEYIIIRTREEWGESFVWDMDVRIKHSQV